MKRAYKIYIKGGYTMKAMYKITSLAVAALIAVGLGTSIVQAAGGKHMVMQVSQVNVDPTKEAVYNYYGQKVAKKSVKNLEGTLAVYKSVNEMTPTENTTVEIFQDPGAIKAYNKSKDMRDFQKAMTIGVTTESSQGGTPFYAKEIQVPLYTMGIADTKILSLETYIVGQGQVAKVKESLLQAESKGLSSNGQATPAIASQAGLYATYMATMNESPNTITVARVFVNQSAYNAYVNSPARAALQELIKPLIISQRGQASRLRVSYDKGGLDYQESLKK